MTLATQPAAKRPRAKNHKARVREESIERILDAAEQLFAEYGYHGVTLKDVAARVDFARLPEDLRLRALAQVEKIHEATS